MKRKFRQGATGAILLAFALSLCIFIYPSPSKAKKQYDLIAFMNECQKMSGDPGVIAIVQWIPSEWWQLTLTRAGLPENRIKEVTDLFEPYVSFIIIHGKITPSGLPSFTPEATIRRHLYLHDEHGRYYSPIDDEEISSGVRNAIIMIRPIFSNMLGRMGDNMNFFFFLNKKKEGGKICSALHQGEFSLCLKDIADIKNQTFQWILPLNSLLPTKTCPQCQREMKGSWKYCPWCGKFLGGK